MVQNLQVFFCYTTISIFPQYQEKLLNIWLQQTFQKVIIYFKTSEQQNYLEIWDAICTIFNIKWGVIGASFNFRTQKSNKMPLVLHQFDVPSIDINQKKHNQLLKSNSISQVPWKFQ